MMTNINLFGGPGIGKSLTAADLFVSMKKMKHNVEYIQEYAKELVYGSDFTKLSDQLYVMSEQHHRMKRLIGKVDYVIHDSPFILGLIYVENDEFLPRDEYESLTTAMFKKYNNINIFITRDLTVDYEQSGRVQNLEEAIIKDNEIKDMLNKHDIQYIVVNMSENIIVDILKLIKESNERK